jgi:hypothetical protein
MVAHGTLPATDEHLSSICVIKLMFGLSGVFSVMDCLMEE